MKYQTCVFELPHTCRCLGTFDSEEKAQTAIDRCQFCRVRGGSRGLVLTHVDVIEEEAEQLAVMGDN
jgi:hypothetical protein